MAILVVDASVALAWCFEDEATGWSDGLLDRLRQSDRVVVPAHWPTEVLNGLLTAERKKRIKAGQAALIWEELSRLPIEMQPPLSAEEAKKVLVLSEKHGLTVYDAAYMELAHRRNLPLATLDTDLRKAAQLDGIALL